MRKFVLYSRDAAALVSALETLRAQNIECVGVDVARFDPRDVEKAEYHILLPGSDADHDDMIALHEVFGVRFGLAGADGTPAEQFAAVSEGIELAEKAPAKRGRKPKTPRPADDDDENDGA